MINEPMHGTHCSTYPFKRICWTAIFVGALVGVGLGFLLNLFGVAIGLSAVTTNKEGAAVLAVGGVIGIFIAVIASMLVSGYAAGYLGRMHCPKRNHGIVYGFTTWSLALLLSAVVAAPLGHYVGAYEHTIAGPVVLSQDENGMHEIAVRDNLPPAPKHHMTKIVASPESLACGAFLLFALFFIGAVSTCVGACWAMTCRRED